MSDQPKFSIVYPTRNRPDLLRVCVEAALNQDYQNWELIISDNSPQMTAKPVYKEFAADPRIRYVSTGGEFSMFENFEFGLKQARGTYVTVLTDKTALLPCCLNVCAQLTDQKDYDLINWSEAHFFPMSPEKKADAYGYLQVVYQPGTIAEYKPDAELDYLLAFHKHRSHDMPHYFRGKILFGCVRRSLIADQIEKGEFFLKYAPDYTTRIFLLSKAKSAVEIGFPLQCAFISGDSNGMLCAKYPDKAFEFFQGADQMENVHHYFPIRGLYTSQQNHVAGDYCYALEKAGIEKKINTFNLYGTVLFDLLKVEWNQSHLRRIHLGLFRKAVIREGFLFSVKFAVQKLPWVLFLYVRNRLNLARQKVYQWVKIPSLRKWISYYETNQNYASMTEAMHQLSEKALVVLPIQANINEGKLDLKD